MVESNGGSARRGPAALALSLLALAGLVAPIAVGGAAASEAAPVSSADGSAAPSTPVPAVQSENASESAYAEPAPEEGDPYFEAVADDRRWISYLNPRDEYREPSLGEGSGKLCVAMYNEAGQPIVGESVPNTTVTIPTGDELSWHSEADPFAVEFPLTDHYERPLDSDQFGTSQDVPQGDGYMDSHCLEWHGLPENETVDYGEAELEGEHADDIEVVGYVQTARDTWETDIDPLAEATPYEEAGGWTYEPDGSHGQAVVVLQLEGGVDEVQPVADAESETSDDGGLPGPGWLGVGALAALVALSIGAVVWRRQ